MSLGAWLVAGVAAAAVPDGLRPVVAAVDAPERYNVFRMTEGQDPAALACETLWPEATLLCLRVWEGGKRRWVVDGDLGRWGIAFQAARDRLAAGAADKISAAELVPIDGMPASYLRLVDGDGWAAAGVLRPDLVAARLGGGPIRVAVPSENVLLAWRADAGPEVDRVMAIGVRELYEKQPPAVSPKVVSWDGARWIPYGEAVPAAAAPTAPAPKAPAAVPAVPAR